jgi:hypothetical protein
LNFSTVCLSCRIGWNMIFERRNLYAASELKHLRQFFFFLIGICPGVLNLDKIAKCFISFVLPFQASVLKLCAVRCQRNPWKLSPCV